MTFRKLLYLYDSGRGELEACTVSFSAGRDQWNPLIDIIAARWEDLFPQHKGVKKSVLLGRFALPSR